LKKSAKNQLAKNKATKKAVVLVSGGLDSTTVLAMALEQGYECYTLSFDYGQRHRAELKAASRLSSAMGACEHKVVCLDLRTIGGSALTDDSMAVPESTLGVPNTPESTPGEEIPLTYVPARNTVFLAIALGWAEVLEAETIFIGVNAVDYSGYPDCRPEFIQAFEATARLATRAGVQGKSLSIATPLIDLSKAEIICRGIELGVDYGLTVSCYQATEEGLACGRCDSCHLRAQGFQIAGIVDPTLYSC